MAAEESKAEAEPGPSDPKAEEIRVATEGAVRGIRSGLTFGAEATLYVVLGAIAILVEAVAKALKGTTAAVRHAAPGGAGPEGTAATAATKAPPEGNKFRVRMLPVDDYDSLNATRAIAALEGLSPDELEMLREYEAGHKNRRTVLGAILARLKGEG